MLAAWLGGCTAGWLLAGLLVSWLLDVWLLAGCFWLAGRWLAAGSLDGWLGGRGCSWVLLAISWPLMGDHGARGCS